MTIAIMQPYFFPYPGYFQLVKAVDRFIFYDDVNFIKNGWINRNRILVNGEAAYFTVKLKDASSFRKIKDTGISQDMGRLLKTIQLAYKKAPCFESIYPVVEECLNKNCNGLSELAISSVMAVSDYLGFKTKFDMSSASFGSTTNLQRENRLISICKLTRAERYINLPGGAALYSRETFRDNGVELLFLEPGIIEYGQYKKPFVPMLSIIDLLMFNPKEKALDLLNNYRIV